MSTQSHVNSSNFEKFWYFWLRTLNIHDGRSEYARDTDKTVCNTAYRYYIRYVGVLCWYKVRKERDSDYFTYYSNLCWKIHSGGAILMGYNDTMYEINHDNQQQMKFHKTISPQQVNKLIDRLNSYLFILFV